MTRKVKSQSGDTGGGGVCLRVFVYVGMCVCACGGPCVYVCKLFTRGGGVFDKRILARGVFRIQKLGRWNRVVKRDLS